MSWPLTTVQFNEVVDVDVSSADHTCNRWCVGLYIGEACNLEVTMQSKPTENHTFHGLLIGTILEGRFATVQTGGDTVLTGTDVILELIMNRQPSVGGR